MVPRHLFADRTFVAANAATFLLTVSPFGAAFLIPQYLPTALRRSALETGLLLPWTGVTMLVPPAAGVLADRIGNRPLMVSGLLLQGVGFSWIGVEATPTLSYDMLLALLLLAGVGISPCSGPSPTQPSAAWTPRRSGSLRPPTPPSASSERRSASRSPPPCSSTPAVSRRRR